MYQNYQQVKVQESPNDVPAGRVPRHKTVVLMDDLIDRAKPGQQVSCRLRFKLLLTLRVGVRFDCGDFTGIL